MRINLMFPGEIEVVLEYRAVLFIINNSFSKRTLILKGEWDRGTMCESARWTMVFKQARYICKRFSRVINDDG